jgi:hypothetical protein
VIFKIDSMNSIRKILELTRKTYTILLLSAKSLKKKKKLGLIP